MKRIYVLTEGPTEEAFVKNVLAPHLFAFDKWPEATSVCTHHERGRRAFRGGALSYNRVRRDLLRLLGSRPEAVTTMFDYYALRGDFPGWDSLPAGGAAAARARHLETALAADIDDARFIPNLVLHEYEGLLFSSPRTIAEVLLDTKHVEALEAIAKGVSTPEEINDGPDTHPSKRLENLYATSYQKPLHGAQIALRIGLSAIRAACPHFSEWLERLETL